MLKVNNAFVTGQNITDLVKKLNDKNAEQAILFYNDINKNTANLNNEISRAQTKEAELSKKIDDNNSFITSKVSGIESKFDLAVSNLESKDRENKLELQSNIDKEKADREAAINQQYETLSGSLNSLDKAITDLNYGAIARQINNLRGELKTYLDNQDQDIRLDLNDEIAERQSLDTNYREFVNSINDRVTAEIQRVDKDIADHLTEFSDLSVDIVNHIESQDNPHNITAEQIGAATLGNLNVLENKVDINNSNVLKNFGDQKLVGNLVIGKDDENNNGHLTVEGDLIVNGATITTTRETQLVEDNFLLLNSNDNRLAAPAGIAVRLGDNTAAAIAYNPATNNFSLGQGTININNDFTFDQNASKHILTTKSELEDKHLLIWDSGTGTVIDGGTYDETKLKNLFASWEAHNSLIIDIDRNSNSIDSLQDIKQNKEDVDLNTSNKTIVGAINELQFNHQDHVNKLNNPHSVTWHQIIDQGNVFTGQNPSMDGTASAGVSEYVARYDHIHPSDTSRAPINHASGSTEYGVASDTEYGHVKLDLVINDVSENPISGKVINSFVNEKIAGLSFEQLSIKENETLSIIAEENGIINVQSQPIKLSVEQVNDLQDKLTNIDDQISQAVEESVARDQYIGSHIDNLTSQINNEISDRNALDDKLTKAIQDEASTRSTADQALSDTFNTQIASVNATLETTNNRLTAISETVDNVKDISESIDSLISKISAGTIDPNQGFMLTFRKNELDETKWDAKFIAMDEGELV